MLNDRRSVSAVRHTGGERLRDLIQTTLPRAQKAGLADAGLDVKDVLLAHRIIYGMVVWRSGPPMSERPRTGP